MSYENIPLYAISTDFRISEPEYRKHKNLSNSDLKFFIKAFEETNDLAQAYSMLLKYRSGKIKTPDNASFKFGRLVDTVLTNSEKVDGYIFVNDNIRNNEKLKNLFKGLKAKGYIFGETLENKEYFNVYRQFYAHKPDHLVLKALEDFFTKNKDYLEILFTTNFDCEIISSKEMNRVNSVVNGIYGLENYDVIFNETYYQIPMFKVLEFEEIPNFTVPMKGLLDVLYKDANGEFHLRDLKTTGKKINDFYHAISNYHYHKQMILYKMLLQQYGIFVKSVGLLAVETSGLFLSKEFILTDEILNMGRKVLVNDLKLLKRAAKAHKQQKNV